MKKHLLLFTISLLSLLMTAQTPGSIDQNFILGNSINSGGDIRVLATQPDGKTLVGGNFYGYDNNYNINIIRLNADGTQDSSFLNTAIGFNGTVNCIVLQPDGKILVGGYFTTYNNQTAKYITRLNTDGTIDSSFGTGSGFPIASNQAVFAIALQADGKILLGGDFSTYNGTTSVKLIRLNTDGSADTSFATGIGFDNSVVSIFVQNDGKILVGGYFLNYNNTTVNGIVRLNTNGSIDLAGIGCNSAVFAMAVQNDGKLLLGGTFTTFGGVSANSIVRLNTDGTVDTTYNTGTGFLGNIRRMVLQPDGKLLAIGGFVKFNGNSTRCIARINTDGTQDTSFALGTGFNNTASTINLLPNGKIMVGGIFNFYNNIAGSCITKLNTDGTKDTSYNPSQFVTNSQVKTIAAQTDGKIIVGGNFNSYFGVASNRIARLNKTDGTLDTSFQTGTGFNYNVNVLAIQTDGKIIAGGAFGIFNNITTNRIIRLNTDGTVDTSFNVGTGFDASVDAIKIQPDGKIVIGGNFTTYNGTAAKRIIRLNTDGSIDSSFVYGTGFNANVWSIVIQTDGKIVIGGDFSGYKGVTSYRIIRLNSDGSKDTTFTTGTGFGGSVYSLVLQPDGKIIAGGFFAGYNSNNTARIVRLNTDGTLDSSFITGSGFDGNVQTIAFQSNGKVVVGGAFSNYNGSAANKICRLNANGSIDTTFIVGNGLNNTVWSLALQEDATMFNSAKIVVGGDFWSCDGVFSNRLVRLNGDSLLATQTFNNASFSIAPNPVAKVLFLNNNFNYPIEKVVIYDLTGKVVLSQTSNTTQVDVATLAKGMYIIEAFSGDEKLISKFVKE